MQLLPALTYPARERTTNLLKAIIISKCKFEGMKRIQAAHLSSPLGPKGHSAARTFGHLLNQVNISDIYTYRPPQDLVSCIPRQHFVHDGNHC